MTEAQKYRLDFALPHAYLRKAGAKLGLRAFRESHRYLDQAERLAPETRDPSLAASVRATRALAYLSCGRLDEAMTAASYGPSVESSRAARAEVSATRSLIRACSGEGEAAARVARRATTVSRALEVTILSAFALAVAACGSTHETARRRVEAAIASGGKSRRSRLLRSCLSWFSDLGRLRHFRKLACSIALCRPGTGSPHIAQDWTNPCDYS